MSEVYGYSLLVLLQNVHAKKAALLEKWQQMATLVHANESQKRVEGDGSEGIGGHAIGLSRGLNRALVRALAGSTRGSDDGDACSELPERVAKVGCSKWSGCHVRSF